MIIVLPYPDKALWPNGRAHWAVKSKATKAHREQAYWATRAHDHFERISANGGGETHFGLPIAVSIILYPKAKGPKPDVDNAQAACKAYLDGIADAALTKMGDGDA